LFFLFLLLSRIVVFILYTLLKLLNKKSS
jgi:hypothetical protein